MATAVEPVVEGQSGIQGLIGRFNKIATDAETNLKAKQDQGSNFLSGKASEFKGIGADKFNKLKNVFQSSSTEPAGGSRRRKSKRSKTRKSKKHTMKKRGRKSNKRSKYKRTNKKSKKRVRFSYKE